MNGPFYLNEVAMYDVVPDWCAVKVKFGVCRRHVSLKVDADATKTSQVVEHARGVELPKHLFKV